MGEKLNTKDAQVKLVEAREQLLANGLTLLASAIAPLASLQSFTTELLLPEPFQQEIGITLLAWGCCEACHTKSWLATRTRWSSSPQKSGRVTASPIPPAPGTTLNVRVSNEGRMTSKEKKICLSCKVKNNTQSDPFSKGTDGASWRRRTKHSTNIWTKLLHRETVLLVRPGMATSDVFYQERHMYQNVYPNTMVHDLEVDPYVQLHKFSLTGRFMVSFDRFKTDVNLHYFAWPSRCTGSKNSDAEYQHEYTKPAFTKFSDFFPWTRKVTIHGEPHSDPRAWPGTSNTQRMLNRDVVLFTPSDKHMIVVSTKPVSTIPGEVPSRPATTVFPTKDYTIHIVCTQNARIVDTIALPMDHISLRDDGCGINLYGHSLSVLSLHHQTIRIFEINARTGIAVEVRNIGLHCYEDDNVALHASAYTTTSQYHTKSTRMNVHSLLSIHEHRQPERTPTRRQPLIPYSVFRSSLINIQDTGQVPSAPAPVSISVPTHVSTFTSIPTSMSAFESEHEKTIENSRIFGSLQQRILSFLYRQARSGSVSSDSSYYGDSATGGINSSTSEVSSRSSLQLFLRNFANFEKLVMLKMQMIDDNHILIRVGGTGHVRIGQDRAFLHMFYVVYNMTTTSVLSIHQNDSLELFTALINGCDYLYNDQRSSCANSQQTRELFLKAHYTIRMAKNGGATNAVRKILSMFPITSQRPCLSPYFDNDMYSYDESVVSPFDRSISSFSLAARFYSRSDGSFKFALHRANEGSVENRKHFVSTFFHPTLPFAITCLIGQECVYTFHYSS